MDSFHKRIFSSPGEVLRTLGQASRRMFGLHAVPARDRVDPQFAERLMLAVTGVNDCLYCTWRHTHSALARGLSGDEIAALLAGELDAVPPAQAVAVAYAQHWAERGGVPEADARARLVQTYGEATARHIEALLGMVRLGNLCSNTVEAREVGAMRDGRPAASWATALVCRPVAFFIQLGVRPDGQA